MIPLSEVVGRLRGAFDERDPYATLARRRDRFSEAVRAIGDARDRERARPGGQRWVPMAAMDPHEAMIAAAQQMPTPRMPAQGVRQDGVPRHESHRRPAQ